MGSRRRNGFIILLVLGLLVASGLVIATKTTVLGLDLKGGTQLVYEARGTQQVPNPSGADIDRAINIIRTRTDKFGVSEPEISRIGATGIQVGLPNVQDAQQAIDQVGKTAQLYFYDLEASIIPPDKKGVPKAPTTTPDPNPNVYTFPDLWTAVNFASTQKASCPQNQCTAKGPTYYLFDKKSHKLLSGPAEKHKDLLLPFKNGKQPAGSVIKSVPQGTLVAAAPTSPSLTLSQQ